MPLKHGKDANTANADVRRLREIGRQDAPTALDTARKYATGGRVGYAEGGETLPDFSALVMPDARMARQIQRRAMAGLDPTPEQRAFLDEVAIAKGLRGDALADVGRELSMAPTAYRTGEALYQGRPGDAAMEALPFVMGGPLGRGLASGAKAAWRGLSSVPRSVTASALGALGLSALPTAAGEMTPSELRSREIDKLNAEIMRHQESIAQKAKEIGAAKFRGVGEEAGLARQKALEEVARPFNNAIARAQDRISQLRAANDEEQGALVVAERDANRMRRMELDRARPFNQTPVGATWEKLGPIAPAAIGAATALLGRLGHGPSAKFLPFVEGTAAGALSSNVPTGWDAFFSPIANPARKAYQTYGEELKIAQHPRAQEWIDYARTLPETNPVRERAQEEFFDPKKAAERMLFGLGEGATGSGIGLASAGLLERLGRGVKSAFGNRPPAPTAGLPSIPSTASRELPGLPGTRAAEGVPLPAALPSRSLPSPSRTGRRVPQDRLPAPEAAPSPTAAKSASQRPPWASDPPPGVKLDKDHHWDAQLGQQRHIDGTFGQTPRYAVERPKKTTKDTKPSTKSKADDTTEEVYPGVPKKPDRPFDPDDPINRGLKDGGAASTLETARRYAEGGYVHGGLIVGDDGGRADTRPVSVPSGSFVIPADCVAALGGGNTLAGAKHLESEFGRSHSPGRAAGGSTPTPIRISDGEYLISPEQVARVGGGDMDQGHRVLDAFVRKVRAEHIKTLKSLPGPAKD